MNYLVNQNLNPGTYFKVEKQVLLTIQNNLPNSMDYLSFKSVVKYDANTVADFGKTASILNLFGAASTITGIEAITDGTVHLDKVKIRPKGFNVTASKGINNAAPVSILDRVGNNLTPIGKDPLFYGPKIDNP